MLALLAGLAALCARADACALPPLTPPQVDADVPGTMQQAPLDSRPHDARCLPFIYAKLVKFGEGYSFQLTPEFRHAIDAAERTATQHEHHRGQAVPCALPAHPTTPNGGGGLETGP